MVLSELLYVLLLESIDILQLKNVSLFLQNLAVKLLIPLFVLQSLCCYIFRGLHVLFLKLLELIVEPALKDLLLFGKDLLDRQFLIATHAVLSLLKLAYPGCCIDKLALLVLLLIKQIVVVPLEL